MSFGQNSQDLLDLLTSVEASCWDRGTAIIGLRTRFSSSNLSIQTPTPTWIMALSLSFALQAGCEEELDISASCLNCHLTRLPKEGAWIPPMNMCTKL
jgi:hypothetical protein